MAPLQVHDREGGRSFEVDVVAATRASASRREKHVQVLGEAKATADPLTAGALDRLDELRGSIPPRTRPAHR